MTRRTEDLRGSPKGSGHPERRVRAYTLHHSFATHLLRAGPDPR